jgi:hypothetical protein
VRAVTVTSFISSASCAFPSGLDFLRWMRLE